MKNILADERYYFFFINFFWSLNEVMKLFKILREWNRTHKRRLYIWTFVSKLINLLLNK